MTIEPVTGYTIDTLFAGDVVRIETYACGGVRCDHEEEATLHHEIVFTRSGSFVRHDRAGRAVASPSDILFFCAGMPYEVSHPLPGGELSTNFVLSPATLRDITATFDPGAADHPDRPFPRPHLPVEPRHHLLHSLLAAHLQRGNEADALAVEEAALMLAGEVLRCAYAQAEIEPVANRADTARAHADLADRARLVINQHYDDNPGLAQIAEAVHCSPFFLCRVFARQTGLSIHQYLQRVRLLNALERLASRPTDDLAQIALDLGFASHSHFSAAFARAFGLTPSAFRQQASGRHLRDLSKILTA